MLKPFGAVTEGGAWARRESFDTFIVGTPKVESKIGEKISSGHRVNPLLL
jgi:hypothetical protein